MKNFRRRQYFLKRFYNSTPSTKISKVKMGVVETRREISTGLESVFEPFLMLELRRRVKIFFPPETRFRQEMDLGP